MKKKILITGSSGFLGEELVNYFSKDYFILALDIGVPIIFKKNLININKISCDIRNKENLKKIFVKNKVDIIIHCAAEILDQKDTKEVWQTNYFGTKNLLDLAEEFDIPKFIFTSTFSIFEKNYDMPINESEPSSAIVDYGKSKYAAENLILSHTYNNDVTIFRCPVIIGKKRLDKLALLFELVRQNLSIWVIGDGSNKIHFIYSLDLIRAINLSLELTGKHLFNIGSDNVDTLYNVFKKLLKHSNSKRDIKKVPKIIGLFLLKLLNTLKLTSLGPYHQRMLVSNCVLDTERIKKKINWKPIYTNEKMLIECYDHYISTFNNRKENTSSKKLPNLAIIKVLKFLNL